MGKLLSFEQRERPARPKPEGEASGEIIIFTGVRYQREVPIAPGNGSSPARPKRKRG